MSYYNAPVKDFQFVLNELADLAQLSQLPGFEEATPEMVASILEEANKFTMGSVAPISVSGDLEGAKVVDNAVIEAKGFKEAYLQSVEGGWVGISSNPEYGGMGLPDAIGACVSEMTSGANMAFNLISLLGQGVVASIEHHGSDELKQTYLEKLITGEWTGTMNLTEPQAGTDLAAVRAKAEPKDDHYLIYGTKIFITWGDHQMTDNIVHLVLARLPDAPPGVKGISLFVVPKFLVNEDGSLGERNDAYAVSVEHKMGIHASPTCVMQYGDNGGAIGYLVGEANKGLAYMFTMMNHARLRVGVQGVGASEGAYQHAAVYAKERVQGRAIGDKETAGIIRHADVRRMLMLMRALTEATRAVNIIAAAEVDREHHSVDADVKAAAKRRVALLTPIAKAWATEAAMEVTSLGVQIHGGMGFIEETGAAQFMRDARILPIYEGTNGVQANDLVGRKLKGDQGAAMNELIAEMRDTQAKAEEAGLKTEARLLSRGLDFLEEITGLILKREDPRYAPTASYNYLMLAGVVYGGALMIQSQMVAMDKKAEDEAFYSAKIVTAKFYVEQVLTRAMSYAIACRQDTNETMMEMQDDWF